MVHFFIILDTQRIFNIGIIKLVCVCGMVLYFGFCVLKKWKLSSFYQNQLFMGYFYQCFIRVSLFMNCVSNRWDDLK